MTEQPILFHAPANSPLVSLPQLRLENWSRQSMLEYFDNTWALTEALFSALQSPAAFYQAPYHQLRHPFIFYYCHPAVLYVNKMRLAGLIKAPVNLYFEQLFETGVDEMSWDDMSKNEMQWPEIEKVIEYRQKVYALVRDVIQNHPLLEPSLGPISQTSPAWSLAMGFEHERIHLETSSVLMRELPLHFLKKPAAWPGLPALERQVGSTAPPENKMRAIPGGAVEIGKRSEIPTFGWDNEYGERKAEVASFEVSSLLISNGEYREFVLAGGYREAKYWSTTGWAWRQFRNSKWPGFWVPNGPAGLNEFKLRMIFEVVDFDPALPVIVNLHEAQAYCVWRTESEASRRPFRLITEAEHYRLRAQVGPTARWNIGLVSGGESQVDAHVAGGLGDVFGNVWQWCEDDFHPLTGFRVHPYYDDFSTPCFDGKHQMIIGGSFVSTGAEASPWARFSFRPHFFQHAGFRIARATEEGSRSSAVKIGDKNSAPVGYESDDVLAQYMLFHYGEPKEIMPFQMKLPDAFSFPQRCAEIVISFAQKLNLPMKKALDIGCAVGRSSFELARGFDQVTGVDLSASFVNAASRLKTQGYLNYFRKDEGDLGLELRAQINSEIDRSRVVFRQADACSLPPEFIDFDAVLMANLLCRLPSPRSCLARMRGARGIVKPGGLLVIVSPYSWLESYTYRQAWLGGFEKEGQAVRGTESLRGLLTPDFECLHEDELPLLIREHERKYQFIVSHLMVWRRKP